MVQTHTPVKRLRTRSLQLTWITCAVFLQVSLVQAGGAGLPTTIWFPFVLSPSSAISPSLSLLILWWEELICDWANLLMVDGRKRSVSRQICTHPCCTCVNQHRAANRTFPCSHTHRNVCTIPAAQLPPPPCLLLPLHLACSAAEERHNYPAGDAHTCTRKHKAACTLWRNLPQFGLRRSAPLPDALRHYRGFIRVCAGCVCVCVDAWGF